VRINPKYASAWYNLGTDYGRLKRYDDSVEALRQAVRINPKYASAWYNLGLSYYFSGNRPAALDIVQELRRLDSKKADELFDTIVPR
jgi:tetratricopeptide (TPR) repeat protein